MPTKHLIASSDSNERGQFPIPGYSARFGVRVPHELQKSAWMFGYWDKLEAKVQLQIDKGEPVTDWVAFAQPLLASYAAPASASGQRSTT